MEIAKLEKLQV